MSPSDLQQQQPDTTVRSFDPSLVERYLDERGYACHKTGETTFRSTLKDDRLPDMFLKLHISFDGADNHLVKILGSRMFPERDFPRLMLLSNTWNLQNVYPKAYAVRYPQLTELPVSIILDTIIGLGPGIHQRFLDRFTDVAISTSVSFWQWTVNELASKDRPA